MLQKRRFYLIFLNFEEQKNGTDSFSLWKNDFCFTLAPLALARVQIHAGGSPPGGNMHLASPLAPMGSLVHFESVRQKGLSF